MIEKFLGDWTRVINFGSIFHVLTRLNNIYMNNPESITPKQCDVFKAFRLCTYDNLKVIIIGQDPYPQKSIATGLAFGNHKDTPEELLSPSLKVLKEASINFELSHNYITFDNSLEKWAEQGVLLLNNSLTVEVNKPGSHSTLWRGFIEEFLVELSKNNCSIIYILLGKSAQSFRSYINSKTNYILEDSHPAYYARIGLRMRSTVFEETNNILLKNKNLKINWYDTN